MLLNLTHWAFKYSLFWGGVHNSSSDRESGTRWGQNELTRRCSMINTWCSLKRSEGSENWSETLQTRLENIPYDLYSASQNVTGPISALEGETWHMGGVEMWWKCHTVADWLHLSCKNLKTRPITFQVFLFERPSPFSKCRLWALSQMDMQNNCHADMKHSICRVRLHLQLSLSHVSISLALCLPSFPCYLLPELKGKQIGD